MSAIAGGALENLNPIRSTTGALSSIIRTTWKLRTSECADAKPCGFLRTRR